MDNNIVIDLVIVLELTLKDLILVAQLFRPVRVQIEAEGIKVRWDITTASNMSAKLRHPAKYNEFTILGMC